MQTCESCNSVFVLNSGMCLSKCSGFIICAERKTYLLEKQIFVKGGYDSLTLKMNIAGGWVTEVTPLHTHQLLNRFPGTNTHMHTCAHMSELKHQLCKSKVMLTNFSVTWRFKQNIRGTINYTFLLHILVFYCLEIK